MFCHVGWELMFIVISSGKLSAGISALTPHVSQALLLFREIEVRGLGS